MSPTAVGLLKNAPPLGYLLRQASAAHRLRMERALSDLDTTPPQFLILTLLGLRPGSSNADLARQAALSTPTVTVILANLKRRGLVASRPHAEHGRIMQLELTNTGQTLLAAGRTRAAVVEEELIFGATVSEIETIRDWLSAVAAANT